MLLVMLLVLLLVLLVMLLVLLVVLFVVVVVVVVVAGTLGARTQLHPCIICGTVIPDIGVCDLFLDVKSVKERRPSGNGKTYMVPMNLQNAFAKLKASLTWSPNFGLHATEATSGTATPPPLPAEGILTPAVCRMHWQD